MPVAAYQLTFLIMSWCGGANFCHLSFEQCPFAPLVPVASWLRIIRLCIPLDRIVCGVCCVTGSGRTLRQHHRTRCSTSVIFATTTGVARRTLPSTSKEAQHKNLCIKYRPAPAPNQSYVKNTSFCGGRTLRRHYHVVITGF